MPRLPCGIVHLRPASPPWGCLSVHQASQTAVGQMLQAEPDLQARHAQPTLMLWTEAHKAPSLQARCCLPVHQTTSAVAG